MDGGSGVLIGVGSALRREGVELATHWETGVDVAVLQNDGSIAKDEIDSTIDITFSIELTEGVCVESVLIAFEYATI